MSILHLSLATLGGAFVAIPIVLHLLMRRQPKPLQFPALRFVRARRESNQRKMRLRQMALLALRCGIIGCLALALARPRVPTALAGNWWLLAGLLAGSVIVGAIALFGWRRTGAGNLIAGGLGFVSLVLLLLACTVFYQMQNSPTVTLLEDAEAPVAAAMVFDVSPRMEYRHQNQSRLETARDLGNWVVEQLAFDSDIGILDTASSNASFSIDRATAKKSIGSLRATANVTDLLKTMKAASKLLQSSDKQRREIYVLTDMTTQSWKSKIDKEWLAELTADPPVMVYVLDVGMERPSNLRITKLDFVNSYLAGEQPLELTYQVTGEGASGNIEVQVLIEKQDPQLPIIVDGKPEFPELVLRGQQQIEVPRDGSASGRFVLNGIGSGTHHGQLRIMTSDGLQIDDTRFFTCAVTRTRDVLVAAGPGAEPSLLTDVLGPEGNEDLGQALFRCQTVEPDELASEQLSEFETIALLDPPPLSVGTWQKLTEYVRQGGGLAIFLGRNAIPMSNFNSAEASELLPGQLSRQWRAGSQNIYLTLGSTDHRIVRGLRDRASTIPWNEFPVFRHWGFEELRQNAVTILRFGNGKPAIVETVVGKGRVLTMTTPISDALNVAGRPPWNLLPTGPNAWPYFVLSFDSFRYLSQSGTTKLNYQIGDAAIIAHDYESNAKLFSPNGAWEEVTSSQNIVAVPFTNTPGHYRLKSSDADSRYGCSVNLPDSQTQMTRIDKSELQGQLGDIALRIARNREEVDREIGESRMGREFFPWLMLAVAIALAMEHLMANRFYAGPPTGQPEPKEAAAA